MPEAFKEYKAAFEAGRWYSEDPGPWLGRTVVFKLQLFLHFDPSEAGPTISFPYGYFTGGQMLFPGLSARFL